MLKIPNYGVARFLLDLRGFLKEEKSDFIAGLFYSSFSIDERKNLIKSLIKATVGHVNKYIKRKKPSTAELTEQKFTTYFSGYLDKEFGEDSFKEIKF